MNVTYTTAFQTAAASVAAMAATSDVRSTDGRMEGVQIGNQLVLFGADGSPTPTRSTRTPARRSPTGSGTPTPW